jgi:Ricin-type beta-trefoil lectin domain
MYGLSGSDNELMTNNSNYELVFKNGKCLDAGDTNNPNNRWLRIDNCHGGSNQKWYFDSFNRLKTNADFGLCVDSANGDVNGSYLYMYNCHGGNNQKWTLR